jgi:hypothetical protein
MLNGRCECRGVRYRVPDEFLYAANCHCSNCRSGTGSSSRSPASSGGEPSIRPTEHIFVGSKVAWFEITDDVPQNDEY